MSHLPAAYAGRGQQLPALQHYPPHLSYHPSHAASTSDDTGPYGSNHHHHHHHPYHQQQPQLEHPQSHEPASSSSYSVVPQTRRRSTSLEDQVGDDSTRPRAAANANGANDHTGARPGKPHPGPLSASAESGSGSGGGPKGASSKRAKMAAAATSMTTTAAAAADSGQPNATGAPPLKRGNACHICRKRKLKCDGQRPICGTCARLKHECQYGDPAQERIAERHRQLEERIKSLEAELASYRSADPASSSSTATLPRPPPLPPAAGHHIKSIPALTVPHAATADGPHKVANGSTTSEPVDPSSLYLSATATAAGILPAPSAGSTHADGGVLPSPTAATGGGGGFPQFSTHELPVEPPFMFTSPVLSSETARDGAESGGPAGGGRGNGNSDGGGHYPTCAPPYVSTGHGPPPPPAAPPHLQSFPFAMNPTPQLSDLVNPTNTGAPSTSSTTAGAPAGYHHHHQQQQQQQQHLYPPSAVSMHPYQQDPPHSPYDAALAPIYGTDLPPLEIMLDLADIYFSTLHLHLPFLHRRRFLYTVHNSASLAAAPSQSLVFAVLALAAAYHDNPAIRAQGVYWYAKARERVDFAISANVHPLSGSRVATLTVEMVQALCLLALIEMGQSDHQRAFLSLGQAVRIAAMLGLTRMDEDRVADRTGQMVEKRLRPPALHPLPEDAVLLEECRRTMCAVYVLDRFESATVGWPAAIAEIDVRVLLPCPDDQFENGRCERDGRHNPLWWPSDGAGTDPALGWEGIRAELDAEGDQRVDDPHSGGAKRESGSGSGSETAARLPRVSTFAWLCRVVWLGSRIQCETYRASGPPPGGPWNRHVEMDPLGAPAEMVEMDRVIEYIRSKLSESVMRKAQLGGGVVDGPEIMTLLTLNCMITNLYHLRAASGLSRLPWDPSSPATALGSSEFAMQRCWQALHSQHEILSHLVQYENAHTSLHRSRLNTFTAFVPYILYTIAFPAKFAIGDWNVLVQSRDRSENVPAHLARDDLPSGDDAFPPSYFERRLAIVDVCCEAMDRIGEVWPVGHKFATMVRGDRMRLAAQTYSRTASAAATAGQQAPPASSGSPGSHRPSQQNGYAGHHQQPHDAHPTNGEY
ncbi:hypothetical protein JCM3774_005023 [Rhodotorula dairenensis]